MPWQHPAIDEQHENELPSKVSTYGKFNDANGLSYCAVEVARLNVDGQSYNDRRTTPSFDSSFEHENCGGERTCGDGKQRQHVGQDELR